MSSLRDLIQISDELKARRADIIVVYIKEVCKNPEGVTLFSYYIKFPKNLNRLQLKKER